jgi:IclR family transcriptional regulator, acetate operon repressor
MNRILARAGAANPRKSVDGKAPVRRRRAAFEDGAHEADDGRAATPATSVRLLDRAIDLIECLEKNRTPMGVRALEAETGISKATAQRLLDAFERRGYVQKDRGRYSLAPATVRLARSYLAGDNLVTVAMPVLQSFAAFSGETCALYVRQGTDRLLVQQVESPHPLRHNTPIGERVPLHLGASGQVLCAGMPKDEFERYLETIEPTQIASGKILRKKDLMLRREQARLRGYAVAVDERFSGVAAVAAPVVHNLRGVIAAVNIAGPSSRMTDRLEQLSFEVRNAAREISEKLSRL